jgi:ribosome-associated protein
LPQTDEITSTDIDLDAIRDQVLDAAVAASGKKATDIAILAVGPLLGITDFFLLLSTANDRQLKAAVEQVEEALHRDHRRKPMGREGQAEHGWVVLDYGDFVVHAFTAEQRDVYDLERLWSDAERVPFTDPALPSEA